MMVDNITSVLTMCEYLEERGKIQLKLLKILKIIFQETKDLAIQDAYFSAL